MKDKISRRSLVIRKQFLPLHFFFNSPWLGFLSRDNSKISLKSHNRTPVWPPARRGTKLGKIRYSPLHNSISGDILILSTSVLCPTSSLLPPTLLIGTLLSFSFCQHAADRLSIRAQLFQTGSIIYFGNRMNAKPVGDAVVILIVLLFY